MGPECFCPGSFPLLQASGVADLLYLEIIHGIEMAMESFEVMSISIRDSSLCCSGLTQGIVG